LRVLKRFLITGIMLAAALLALAGCDRRPATRTATGATTAATEGTNAATVWIDTGSLRVEAEGQEIRVYDLTGGQTFTFTLHKTRVKKTDVQHVCEATTTATTATIEIKKAHNLIIVTDRTTGQTYYIKP